MNITWECPVCHHRVWGSYFCDNCGLYVELAKPLWKARQAKRRKQIALTVIVLVVGLTASSLIYGFDKVIGFIGILALGSPGIVVLVLLLLNHLHYQRLMQAREIADGIRQNVDFLDEKGRAMLIRNPKKESERWTEKDNLGTRIETYGHAESEWLAQLTDPQPRLIYIFKSKKDAEEALLDLPFIHIASDSKKLICTEILLFGVYQSPEKQYHAIINGNDMTTEIWEQARQVFASHGGKKLSDIEPTKSIPPRANTTKETGNVVFVREYQEAKMGGLAMCTYKMYRADNAQSAKEFLSNVVVTEQLYYIVVETPEGNYARDIQGIYKE